MEPPAVAAAEFVIERVHAVHRHRARQAKREVPLPCRSTNPALRWFAEQRFFRIRELEARTLIEWANRPEMAMLSRVELTPAEIVSLQAEGQRCVSLLADAPPDKGLEFALHDLRHLGKFFDPASHRAQIGFFASIRAALESPAWLELDRGLDERWRSERDTVLADMNGTPVFLFSVMKMKLRMAARRRCAADCGRPAPESGGLSDEETRVFEDLLETCLDGFDFPPEVRAAARAISCRRDAALHARGFLRYFETRALSYQA